MFEDSRRRLVGAVRVVLRRPDDRARHDHRERRAALHPRGPAILRDLAGVGGQRLHADVRRLPVAGRPARRPVRSSTPLPARAHPVHRGVARLRPRARPGTCWSPRAPSRASAARWSRQWRCRSSWICSPKRANVPRPWASMASCVPRAAASVCCSAASSPRRSNWHWIFLVNLPIGARVYFACLRLLPHLPGTATGTKLDVAGAITVTTSLMLAVYAIVNGHEVGWRSTQTMRDPRGRRRAARCVPRSSSRA